MTTNTTLPVKWIPQQLEGKWFDVFLYRVNSQDGLPPDARAKAIISLARQLKNKRRAPCLHVVVIGRGKWYREEIKFLTRKIDLPVAVTPPNVELHYGDFRGYPFSYPNKPKLPDFGTSIFEEDKLSSKVLSELMILRSLARTSYADTKEISSLSGLGVTQTGKLLKVLERDGFVAVNKHGFDGNSKNHNVWSILKTGVQYVHRSWNIPEGTKFKGARVEQKAAGIKHRKISRWWPWWLREAYKYGIFELWSAWTEPEINGAHPDALGWGMYDCRETLFWLEVESGKKSRSKTVSDIEKRYSQAAALADIWDIQIVFVVLSQPWVLKALTSQASFLVNERVAIVFENWQNKACLGRPVFGGINSYFESNDYPLARDVTREFHAELGFETKRFDPSILINYCEKK